MSRVTKFLVPSWDDVEELAMEVAEEVLGDGYRPDVVVGVLRGGAVAAKLVADYLGVERLAFIEVKFYAGIGVRREEPVVTQPLVEKVQGLRVLLVDDVADTGKTLAAATSYISMHGPEEVKTATLYLKPWSMLQPDYYGEVTDAWIIFPWERMEAVRELVKEKGMSLEEAARIAGVDPRAAERLLRLHQAT